MGRKANMMGTSVLMTVLIGVLVILVIAVIPMAIKEITREKETNEITYENYRSNASTLEDACEAIVKEIITPDMKDYDKYKAIHDWMCWNVYYDHEGLSWDNPEVHDPRLVLYYSKGVCDGYALAYEALCEEAGLRCGTLTGLADTHDGESWHAWNWVCLDGIYYQVDVCWDDMTDIEGYEDIRYDYWLRGRNFMKADSREDPTTGITLSDEDY